MPAFKRIVYFAPRVLSIAFALFLSLFALDVFGAYSGWELVLALFMHLLPVIFLFFLIAVSWKYDLAGAIVFLAFAVFYVKAAGLDRPWSWYVFISGPAMIVSALFFASWLLKRKSG